MASFSNLEIASAVSSHENIYVKHSFLGFGTKVYYRPTLSLVDSIRNYYTMSSGNALHQFLFLFQRNPSSAEGAKLQLDYDPNGNYSLEMCAARDGQFIALQLFRYSDLAYNPVTDILIREGKEAEVLCLVLRGK